MAPRILVTRSRHQTSDLARHLSELGAELLLVPTITFAPPLTYAPLDTALANLGSFDWLIFTSANAVRVFGSRWSLRAQASPQVAAIGSATAEALTEIGLQADLLPPRAVAESLAQVLAPRIVSGHTRVLLVRAEAARDHLPEVLRAAGADLTIAAAYRTILPESSISLLQDLFRTPDTWPDAITFTSSSTATNLFALLEAAGLTLPPDAREHKPILRASIGPITSKTLLDLGYPAHVEAPEASIGSLVAVLAKAFGLPRQ